MRASALARSRPSSVRGGCVSISYLQIARCNAAQGDKDGAASTLKLLIRTLPESEGAKKAGLLCGAYHYFTMTSSGKNQAANFIRVVPAEDGSLPPVVDVETTGADRGALLAELRDLVGALEQAYGQKPILYAVRATYNDYIKGEFDGCPIWIRDIVKPPALFGNTGWHFWQYCSRGHVEGIDTYVDLNVFYGDSNDLESLLSEE